MPRVDDHTRWWGNVSKSTLSNEGRFGEWVRCGVNYVMTVLWKNRSNNEKTLRGASTCWGENWVTNVCTSEGRIQRRENLGQIWWWEYVERAEQSRKVRVNEGFDRMQITFAQSFQLESLSCWFATTSCRALVFVGWFDLFRSCVMGSVVVALSRWYTVLYYRWLSSDADSK